MSSSLVSGLRERLPGGPTHTDAARARAVAAVRVVLRDPQLLAQSIGAGRLVLGAGFMAAPTASVRVLGVDTATAKRMRFLARMLAGRDMGIGAGTLAGARDGSGGAAAPWLLAGAAADVIDAAAITTALRQGVARGPAAGAIAVGAVGAAAAAVWAAAALRRH